jgi:hypothetical protein
MTLVCTCEFGDHLVLGPPEPFCCHKRRDLILRQAAELPAVGVVYLDDSDSDVPTLRRRARADLCDVCGTSGDSCNCRYCYSCSRFWGASTPARRDEKRQQHGVATEECPECKGGHVVR